MKNLGKIDASAYRRCVEKRLFHLPANGASVSPGRWAASYENGDMRLVAASDTEQGLGEDTGACALFQAVNTLAAAGAEPLFVSLQAFAPADMDERSLHPVFDGAALAAREMGLAVINADTYSLSEGPGDCAVITASVLGKPGASSERQEVRAGQDIVMAGYAGWQGSRRLFKDHEEELRGHFSGAYLSVLEGSLADIIRDVEKKPSPESGTEHMLLTPGRAAVRTADRAGVSIVHAAGEGGIFSALWDMGERAGLGLRVWLDKICIRQETVEICDFLDINPYLLMSHGVMLMATEQSGKLVEELLGAGIPAAVVGHFSSDKDRLIICGEEKRFMEPFRGDSFFHAECADNKLSV